MTVFPNDEDGRDPQELTVHVLSNEGFQIRGEVQRRPAMTEEEKTAKRANRMVCYALLPAEMMNLRASAYDARLDSFKATVTAHFLKKGAADVGFCQSRNDEGHNTNRTCVFIEFPAGLSCENPEEKSKDLAALSLSGTKYIDIQCSLPAKIKFRTRDGWRCRKVTS